MTDLTFTESNRELDGIELNTQKFSLNFRSIKGDNRTVNGTSNKSIEVVQDDTIISMKSMPFPYNWNMSNYSNDVTNSIYGVDNHVFGNTISSLKSSDTTFNKFYGNCSKFIAKGSISKGDIVKFHIDNGKIKVKRSSNMTDNTTEFKMNTSVGICLNTVTDSNSCYICTSGITEVNLAPNNDIEYGDFATISSSTPGNVDKYTESISTQLILGYFIENTDTTTSSSSVLFYYQPMLK